MTDERNTAPEGQSTDRELREDTTRSTEVRPSDSYVPASKLPTPKDQDGYTYRWVRTSMVGQSDVANVSSKMREGWVPVKLEDHPELMVEFSDLDSRFAGNVEIGGLLLCKAPIEKVEARRKYYQNLSARQMDSVDHNYLREQDPRMPMLKPDRKTRTSFGEG